MVRIRLRRIGRRKAPVYRLVVADSKSPRDGKFIEIIGQYAPRQSEGGLNVQTDRALYWLSVGAQPSDTARSLLRKAGVLKQRHETRLAAKLQASAVPLAERPESESASAAAAQPDLALAAETGGGAEAAAPSAGTAAVDTPASTDAERTE
jgi:small subunit ribosomal protein S16